MIAWFAIMVLTLLAFSPASAENLDAQAARHFVLGKLFAFTCFDGSRGAGRVYDDGFSWGHPIAGIGSGPFGMVAAGHAEGQRQHCLRVAQQHTDRTML
jgi:hypothetical protein